MYLDNTKGSSLSDIHGRFLEDVTSMKLEVGFLSLEPKIENAMINLNACHLL